MSTRQSIVYVGPLHIYNECISNEICIEVIGVNLEHGTITLTKYNEKYGASVISKEDLRRIYEELGKYLGAS